MAAPTVAEIVAAANADDETYATYAARRGGRPRGLVTLADVARRTLAGEEFFFCVREHLSALTLLPVAGRPTLVAERPADLPDGVAQAYLGALAEHACAAAGVAAPRWAVEPDRFLDRLWFAPTGRGSNRGAWWSRRPRSGGAGCSSRAAGWNGSEWTGPRSSPRSRRTGTRLHMPADRRRRGSSWSRSSERMRRCDSVAAPCTSTSRRSCCSRTSSPRARTRTRPTTSS